MYDNSYVSDTYHTPAAQHDKHGDRRFPGPAQYTRDAVGKRQQEIEQGDGPGLGGAKGNYLRVIVKGRDQRRGKNINYNTYYLSHDDRAEDAEAGSFFGAFILLCPQVLAHEGGQ